MWWGGGCTGGGWVDDAVCRRPGFLLRRMDVPDREPRAVPFLPATFTSSSRKSTPHPPAMAADKATPKSAKTADKPRSKPLVTPKPKATPQPRKPTPKEGKGKEKEKQKQPKEKTPMIVVSDDSDDDNEGDEGNEGNEDESNSDGSESGSESDSSSETAAASSSKAPSSAKRKTYNTHTFTLASAIDANAI